MYDKFGCEIIQQFSSNQGSTDDGLCSGSEPQRIPINQSFTPEYDTNIISEETLQRNLNAKLFQELYTFILKNLNDAYMDFKNSINYQILKMDIHRQEQLYEVLIEGKFLRND